MAGPASASESFELRPLFGGAAEASVPSRFKDVSDFRQVPDNQEVFADGDTDESILIELLELKADVADSDAATWFFRDLCSEQDASTRSELEASAPLTEAQVPNLDPGTPKGFAVGQMVVSKGREGLEAGNLVKCYLANIRLRSVSTDILVTVYEPLAISETSSVASALGAGPVVRSEEYRLMPASQVFRRFLESFKINDWGLFAGS